MRKLLLMLAIFFAVSCGKVSAQEVTVTGMGSDRDSAIRNAAQTAVEQVVGVYINSQTLMQDLKIQLDEVYKKSQGFVKGIKILSEDKLDSTLYKVQARIDVDTSPNGKLIDELTMILQLNDPRIAVIVFDSSKIGDGARDIFAEGYLSEKLLSMGFSHVVDTDSVIKINDAALLDNIASGRGGFFSGSKDNAVDYLVLGRYNKISNAVSIPKFGSGRSQKTDLKNITTTLKITVLKYDTGDIVGTFTVEANDVNISEDIAVQNAVAQVSNQAAEKLSDTFKKFSSQPTQGLTFTIAANNEKNLNQCIEELRELGMVNNVYIREMRGNEAVLTVDSAQKPHAIFSALKVRTKLKISIANMSANSCKLRID